MARDPRRKRRRQITHGDIGRRNAVCGQPEALEPRHLLAVTPLLTSEERLAVADLAGLPEQIAHPATNRSLVVIDASASADGQLAGSFSDAAATLVVGSGDDVFARVGDALASLGGASAIHLVTHGAPGRFTLGDAVFAADTVDDLGPALLAWNRAMGPGADLYLWGCDIAGSDGAALVDSLHALSGFDVAASIDVTGPAALGGDFDLEYSTGEVAAPVLVTGVDVLWDTTLAAPVAYDFTSTKVKTAVNAAFDRLETAIAPAIRTALANSTDVAGTDVLAQRSIADLWGGTGSISPDDVATLLALKTDVATYLAPPVGSPAPTLAGLAAALQARLVGLATTAGAAAPTVTVTPTVTTNLAGTATALELAVSIVARGTTTAPLDRGPDASPTAWGQVLGGLDSDLNLTLRAVPQLETGSEFTGAVTISVDLADPDNPVASIAIPTLDLKAGLFGFAGVTGRIGALDLDSVRGAATPVHTTSVTFSGGASKTVAGWSSVGATASALSSAPAATVTLPVVARLGSADVSTADTKVTIAAANVLDAAAKPTVTLADFGKLQWFGAISSDDIVTAVLSAGRAYGAAASADGSILAVRVPFAAEQTLGTVFDFADLFADEIGSQIDVTVDKTTNGTTIKVRPDDLQTFGDFARKFPALGITPVYDAAAGTVSLQFSASRTNSITVKPAVEFPIAPLGTVTFPVTATRTLSAPVALGFGVRFDVAPSAALVIQLPAAAASSGKLSADAGFTITPAFGTPTTVTVRKDDSNGSATDLLDDLNAALDGTPLRARVSDFGGGFELYAPTVDASMPAAITITASRTAANRELGFSDGLADDASTPYTLFGRTSAAGSKVVPHATKDFATGAFTLSLDDLTGQVGYGLNSIAFADTAGSTSASLALKLAAAGSDAETLGTDPASVLGVVLTGEASVVFSGLTHANGSSPIKAGSTITVSVADFTKERETVFTPTGVPLSIANLEADGRTTGRLAADATLRFSWGDDTYDVTVAAADANANGSFSDLVGDFVAALGSARRVVGGAASGAAVDISGQFSITGAAGRLTVLRTTETPASAVLSGELVPNLAAGGATTGRLSADASLEVIVGSTTFTVAVPRVATLDNTSFADLVDDVNAAVTTAARSVAGGEPETVNATADLQFQASGSNLQPLAPQSVVNPRYATVTVPANADLGQIGYQAGLTATSVATALRDAGRIFPMLGRDVAAYAETELPLLNAPLADLIALDTGFTGRVETLRAATVTSIAGLERAIETALGLPAGDLTITFDADRQAYRIDLAYKTSVTQKVGFDLDLQGYYSELGRLMPQGINELADTDEKTPLTVVLTATSVLSVGIDLGSGRTFVYGHDGSATRNLDDGTSFQIGVSVNGTNLAFPARFGMFVRGGTAKIENGALVVVLDHDAATPGSAVYHVDPATAERGALDAANYAAVFAGKVDVVMPIFDEFAPARLTAASATEAAAFKILEKHPASLYLGIDSLADYMRISGQIADAKAALLELRQSGAGSAGGLTVAEWQAVLAQNSDNLPQALKVFAPELANAKNILGADNTLIDMIRDPALILDTLDQMLRYAENALAGVNKLDLPLVGNSLGGAVNGLFGFRRGWLLDMRQKTRGQGEAVLDVMRQQIFEFLGPKGVGILLVNNGLRSADGMVGATKATDVGLDFLDKAGKKVTTGVSGADAFEITVRLGQKLFDTGVDLGFQFDALAPMISLGLDGGLRLQMGWDIQLGFGYSLTNGAYIKLDPDAPEAQVRFDASLTGKSAEYKPQWTGSFWKIVDGNGRDVIDPVTNSAYRALAVDKKGVDVTASVPLPGTPEAAALDPCEEDAAPAQTSSGSQVWWVVAAKNSAGNWRPAELNDEMRYVAQAAPDANGMIEVEAMAPARLSGSLAFLTLTATDMIRRGLSGVADYDNAYLFDASSGPQNDAKARDDRDTGVNRNNQLATLFTGVIGIDIADPSADKKTFKAVPDASVTPDGFKLADSKGAEVLENGAAVPLRQFYEYKLRQGPGAGYRPLDLSVKVATTSNIQLSGIGIVDGVQLAVNDRVLVKNQVNAEENGVYTVSARGWSRSFDADSPENWNEGGQLFVFVEDGRVNKTTGWAVDPRVGTIALGTTPIVFTRVESVNTGGTLVPWEPYTTLLLPKAIVDRPIKNPVTLVVWYDASNFVVTLPATESTGVANRAVQITYALRNAFEDKNGDLKKDADEPVVNLVQAGFSCQIPAKGNKTEPKSYVIEVPKTPRTGTRVIVSDGWYPVRDINADASRNRLTFAELRSGGTGIFKIDVSATAVANFQLALTVGDGATLPKIYADLNLDWSTKSARAKVEKAAELSGTGTDTGAKTGADKGIDPNSPQAKEMDLLPEIGLSNVRLDLGSFLTQFVKPIVDTADPYLEKIRPVLQFLTAKVPVISDVAGTDIRVVDLIEKFGGEKAKGVRSVVDTVAAIDAIVARIAALPGGVNVQLPLGRFWFPKEADKQTGDYAYGKFRYDNVALGINTDRSKADAAANAAFDALTALKDANPDSAASAAKQKGILNAADRGGFRIPILDNPLTAFKLMMGEDVPLFTFQLPKLQYQLEKSIPLLRIVCFEVGLKMGFEMNAKLSFGFDTYGFKLYGDSGDPLDVAQGFYVSDRSNADGTGPDVPEFQTIVSFGLYGGVDVLFAKAGIEGGVRVTADVNLNDPNDDGKLRLTEALGLVVDTGDPLDLFDVGLKGEAYARYYYDVLGLISGGADFARITIFNLEHQGSDGTPLYGSTDRDGTLLLHVGESAAKRVSNQDPLNVKDGSERFSVRNVGDTVYVTYHNYDGSKERAYDGVRKVVFAGGVGNDELNATGLSGIPLVFDGGVGNDRVILGAGSGSVASRLDGGDGDDTIEVLGGGIVEILGGLGADTITGGTGTVWIDAGSGNDDVTTRSSSTTTISFSDQYGHDDLALAPAAAVNRLDFSGVFSSVEFDLAGTSGHARAGTVNTAAFNVTGVTEILGTGSPDTFTVKNPETRDANSGKGLVLRGGLGDDVYDFTIDGGSKIAANGILVDDVRPITPATAGTPTVAGTCKSIESIPVASAGSGYAIAPDVVILDATGYGAKATATIDERGRVISIQVIEEGRDYTSPTVLLVNAVSYADKIVFTSALPAAALTRSGTTHTLGVTNATNEAQAVRFEGWGGVGATRPAGFDASEVDSLTVNLPAGVFTLGSSIDLFDTFTVNASRMVQDARIVADTVAITTDHGFQVKHAIDTTNSGDVRIRVTGRAHNDDPTDDINVTANMATATATVSGGSVTGVVLGRAGDSYYFDPSITVGAEIASAGTGARFTANRDGDSLSGFTKLAGGSGYLTSPAPLVVIPPPASIQIDAMVTSSAPGGLAGVGDGRGKVILFADTGMVNTSGEVFFPTSTRPGAPQGSRTIDWIGGDYRYRSSTALDDLVNPVTYPGISVGTGAVFTAVLDAEGRVTGFTRQSGGSGYTKALPPQVDVEGLATATAVVGDDGTITSLTLTYPGDGYGQTPRVTIRPNGFGRIVNSPNGPTTAADGTPLNRVHIRAIGGTLVAVAGAGVGDPLKPLKSDVETFVARATAEGRGVHVLEKDGVRIGSAVSVDGIVTHGGPVTLTTFGGAIELGAPKQALDTQGRPLWQDAAKTIPIYERDPVTNKIVYEGGQIAVGAGNVKLTADDVEVNVPLGGATVGGTIELQPVKVNAQIGLSGTRARTAAVIDPATGRLTGFDATAFWGGRGYTSAPLVIVDPAGQRAFGSAVVQDGAVVGIDVIFAGTNYSATEPPTITLTGGGGSGAEATAIVAANGTITGFTIIKGGGGYSSSPAVAISTPGQALVEAILESQPDPVSGRYSVKEFRITNAGRNYTTAPSIEVAAPYDFTLDGDEIAQFDTAFRQVVIGRIEGQHLFHSPEATLGSGVVLRAPRAGGTLDVASLAATGPVSIIGSGTTFHFDAAAPTVSGASISIDDNVIVHAGVSAVATATTGDITIFGSGKGMIDGDPLGDDVGDDEDLTLSAQTTLTVAGAIGSRWRLDDLTVTSAGDAAIALQQSVALTGSLHVDGGALTIGGAVDVGDDLVVDSTGAVLFSGDVTVAGDLWIKRAGDVTFAGTLTVLGSFRIDGVTGSIRFTELLDGRSSIAVSADVLVEVLGGVTAGGDASFTSDEINFKGGEASVSGPATATLTMRPATPGRGVRVGSPLVGTAAGSLDISDGDLAAIAGGWKSVVIGDATLGTGAVTVGSIGRQQGSRNSWLASPTTIVGGSVRVAEKVDVAAAASPLSLVARTGGVTVAAAINETAAERNARVIVDAATTIALDAAVRSTQDVVLVAGTTITQAAAAPLVTGGLKAVGGGAVSLTAAANAFDLLAVATSDDDVAVREDSGYTVGTVDGTTGISAGTGTVTLTSSGIVMQTQPIAAATLSLRGVGGTWTLTGGNSLGALTADTGSLAVRDVDGLTVGAVSASAAAGTAVDLAAAKGIALSASMTTGGGDVKLHDAATLVADVAITLSGSATSGTAVFLSTVDGTSAGQQSLAVTGNLDARASVGGTTALESLAVSGDSALADGITLRTVGDQAYSGKATSAGTITVQAGEKAAVKFLGDTTLEGLVTATAGYAVVMTGSTVAITNAVTFGNTGAVTLGDQSTDDLWFKAGIASIVPSTTSLAGTIRTSDAAATFGQKTPANHAITLVADTTVSTGTGKATFSGTVDGPHRLDVNASGDTTFSSAVGGGAGTALTHLETDAPGTTFLDGGAVTTASPASQVYNDDVLLGADTTLDAGAGAVTFAKTLNGFHTLAVNTTGITTFGGTVGAGTPLESLTTDAGGSTNIDGGAVTTAGLAGQIYYDDVRLGGTTTLAADNGGAITFADRLDGPGSLVADTQGTTTFMGPVGGLVPLASLTTDAGGTTSVRGASVRTTGSQSYRDDVDMPTDTRFEAAQGAIGGGSTSVFRAPGRTVTFVAAGDIGTAAVPIRIAAGEVTAVSAAGDIHLVGIGDLAVGAAGLVAPLGRIGLDAGGKISVPTGGRIAAGVVSGSGVTAAKPIHWSVTTATPGAHGSLSKVVDNANQTGVEGRVIFDTLSRGAVLAIASPLTVATRLAFDGGARGVVVDGGNAVARGLVLNARAAGSTVTGVTLQNFTDAAIVLQASPGTTIRGCVIQANGNGIRASGLQSGTQIVGNTFAANRAYGIHLDAAAGILVDGNRATGLNTLQSMGLYATGDLRGARVINNTFSRGLRGALLQNARNLVFGELGAANLLVDNLSVASSPTYAGTGIRAEGDMAGTTVTGNTFARNNYGFAFIGARNLRLSRNTLQRNSIAGILVQGVNTGSSQATNVFGAGVNKNKVNIVRQAGSRGV